MEQFDDKKGKKRQGIVDELLAKANAKAAEILGQRQKLPERKLRGGNNK